MLQVVRKKLGPDEVEFWIWPGFIGLLVLLGAFAAVFAGPIAVNALAASGAQAEAVGLRRQNEALAYENAELRQALVGATTRLRALENAAR